MRNIYDCIYDFEKMVFVFYEIWQFLCFFYLIYFVFSWLWWFLCLFLFYDVVFDFLFFCFSFLNNWLENIERTITLHVFFIFQTHGEQQTNNNVFLFHTHGEHWTNIDFAFIYLFKFILALALGLVVFWPLVSEKRIEQQILQISQTAPTAAWWQAVRCQWWLTNKKTNYVVCVCVGGGQGDANVGASWSTNSVTIFSGASGQQVTCIQLLATNN